jgi:hypothetical protein
MRTVLHDFMSVRNPAERLLISRRLSARLAFRTQQVENGPDDFHDILFWGGLRKTCVSVQFSFCIGRFNEHCTEHFLDVI